MYTDEHLNEVRKLISRFATPVELMNDGLVIITDPDMMDGIGETLYHMDINQRNLCTCYKDCTQGVFINREKNERL